MSPGFQIDSSHLRLVGAGPGVGAAVVRRFGREGFRSTLLSRGERLQTVAAALRQEGIVVDTLVADASDLDSYHSTLESLYAAPGAPAVLVYNASILAPDEILTSSVERLRTAYDVDVLGGVVAAQVAAPVMCGAGSGTILFTGGGFADYPVPALASLSLGKAALRSAATLIADEVASDGVHAASITIVGQVAQAPRSTPTTSRSCFGRLTSPTRLPGRRSTASKELRPTARLTPLPHSPSRAEAELASAPQVQRDRRVAYWPAQLCVFAAILLPPG